VPQTTVSITVTTPDDVPVADLVRDLSDFWGWTAALGVTRAAFVKRRVAQFVKESYIAARASAAAETARTSAAIDAERTTVD
jgi:hypothetical protein